MTDVSVVGCGNMGGALIEGLARDGRHEVVGCDVDPDALAAVEPYCRTTDDLAVATDAPVVVLAVKPDAVPELLAALDLAPETTLVTLAAGVDRSYVAAHTDATVVRVMPNLAARSGQMAAAVAWDRPDERVAAVLDAVGEFVVIDESLMDVATALNGSGPAFVFYLLRAMKEAAAAEGLDDDAAERLAAQTFRGAAETVLRADEDVERLIDAVCSPGGTTIEGMRVLRDSAVEPTLGDALDAAAERSAELADEHDLDS